MSKRVLVVDDSPLVRNLVKKALNGNSEFCVVGEAANGKEAVDLAQKLEPDIITLDVTMPVMDGLDAAREILKQNSKIKILLLSAMGDDALLSQAQSLGIKHSLQKPFRAEQLLEALRKLLEV
ncbi:MAG: response regulator [Pseudothermotoga sp.]|uniref:response regulator n=1 Tax=Pseudothermotoga sp. TaxID=2033661 RepID=UPI000E923B9F|nr:response regulator [Pseudothermotoga sp.]MDK2923405.1 two-component system, chemotaxis family, chemotaxis protein CheY [Pseudothermotoga sp.]HBT38877.1 two-component system response regulator [Pseudothermotoga sp.]HCO97874.1 two-component system response regulator [Pseudothermotoga sp.]